METRHTSNTVKETNVLGFYGIFKILGFKRIFCSTWVEISSVFLTFSLILIFFFLNLNPFDFLVELKSLILNLLPSIIGFSLAGYALVVGFVQAGMLNRITEPLLSGKDNFSLYQKMSAAFAMNIILQIIGLLIAIFIHILIIIDENNHKFILADSFVKFINWMGFLIISYWFFLSLLLTVQIVLNIFGFSQLHQYLINKDKLNKNKSDGH